MSGLLNMVKVNVTSTGTGTLTLGTAIASFLTLAGASAVDGQAYSYVIEEGSAREIGWGVAGSSGTTLTRNCVNSTNSNAPISLTGSAIMYISPLADELYTQPPIASGEYLALFGSAAQRAANAQTGKSYFLPFRIWRKITIQSLLMRVGTPGVSGAQCALTIYRTVANTYPVGAPLNAGTGFSVSTALINTGYTGLNLPLMPGIYWLGFQTSNATVDYFILDGGASSFANFAHRFAFTGGNDDTNAIVSQQPALTRNDTFGSWPTLTGAASDFSGTSFAYLMPGTVVRAA